MAIKYQVSSGVIRRANQTLIRNGVVDSNRNGYNGNISIRFSVKGIMSKKTFNNEDIKGFYAKALRTYAERV